MLDKDGFPVMQKGYTTMMGHRLCKCDGFVVAEMREDGMWRCRCEKCGNTTEHFPSREEAHKAYDKQFPVFEERIPLEVFEDGAYEVCMEYNNLDAVEKVLRKVARLVSDTKGECRIRKVTFMVKDTTVGCKFECERAR